MSNNKVESTGAESEKKGKLPGTYLAFTEKYPELGQAHEAIANAVYQAGPLDRKTCELVKIGLCVGAGLESALRSHVRRAMQQGATQEEVEQAILLAMNTCGFPRTVMAWQWAQQQFERERLASVE
jgi:4-carboxymuconolactone decarboxylase